MSDYGDNGYGVDDYGSAADEVTIPAGTPLTPQVIPRLEVPKFPTPMTGPVVSKMSLAGLQLGDFTPSGTCSIRALSRVAYRFFTQLQNGDTSAALVTLGVWRSLYNARRNGFVGGFSPVAQALLPASLPQVEWSDALRQAMAVVIAGGLGAGHPALAILESLPVSMASVGAWFLRFQGALVPGNIAFLREYVDILMPSGSTPAQVLTAYVNDDLSSCTAPAVATPPPPTSPPVVPRNTGAPTSPAGGGRGGAGAGGGAPSPITSAAAPVSSSTGMWMTAGLVAFAGYGLYLAVKDKPSSPKVSKLGEFKHPDLVEKAKKAAKADGKMMKCIAGPELYGTTSMDELAGPKGERLARVLAKMDPADANSIEAVYFAELAKHQPRVCPPDRD